MNSKNVRKNGFIKSFFIYFKLIIYIIKIIYFIDTNTYENNRINVFTLRIDVFRQPFYLLRN